MDDYNTPDALLQIGVMDPNLARIIEANPIPPTDYSLPVEQLRQPTSALEKMIYDACPTLDTKESVQSITMRDGYQSELRVIKPPTVFAESSLVVLIYGGAFFSGSNIQVVPWARAVASFYNAVVALPSYRLAPEYPFPVGAQDIWDNVKWLAANASSLGADPSMGFVLGGASAGGNMAIVAAQRALKEQLLPPVTGILATVPACLHEKIVPGAYRHLWISRTQNADAPICGLRDIDSYEKMYQADALSEDYSPYNSEASFSGLPRTYVQIAGMDGLRDDGMIYARSLRDAGVDVRLDVYSGMPHGHYVVWPRLTQSVESHIDTVAGVGWLLRREIEREDVRRLWMKVHSCYPVFAS